MLPADEETVERLWNYGADTKSIAFTTGMREHDAERLLHRILDRKYRARCQRELEKSAPAK